MNTCSATSRICEIQGGKGILRYRGYPIEQLAERSTFTEVSFLLIYGQLPDAEQLKYFNTRVMRHTFVHEDLKKVTHNKQQHNDGNDARERGHDGHAAARLATPTLLGQRSCRVKGKADFFFVAALFC